MSPLQTADQRPTQNIGQEELAPHRVIDPFAKAKNMHARIKQQKPQLVEQSEEGGDDRKAEHRLQALPKRRRPKENRAVPFHKGVDPRCSR